MIKQDIPLYKLDLTGLSKFNAVTKEYSFRKEVVNNDLVIPPKGPFYQNSFKMYDMTGKPLVKGVDYEFYGIMAKLTQFTGKPVGLFIKILKSEITQWYADYQVVGNFNKITTEILNMLKSIHEDDRFVLYENIKNKPLWFIPKLHQHDLAYDIFGFTDLVKELNRVANWISVSASPTDFALESFQEHLDVYIAGYKKVLLNLLDEHTTNKLDAHGVSKTQIGLGLVDNFATATLEETLEGLREDLRISVYNAATVIDNVSGKSNKLVPSGSLPILRYGSDTFIPPSITGSFEGLGGTSRRSGAIVETDGTLLILSHRNNGRQRGLYFSRCKNWTEVEPIYEFTEYRYIHPTATAADATLDTIINGSNRYVMVVGDRVKNLWWWCETHGTFNPSRHTLIPLTGPWVTEDMGLDNEVSDIFNIVGNATIVADKNYAQHWAIIQAYTIDEFVKRRPTQVPDYETLGPEAYNYGHYPTTGLSINIVVNKAAEIKRANIDYTHPIFGNFNDAYFAPWFPNYELIDGIRKCTSHYGIFDAPVDMTWGYRDIFSHWISTGNAGEFAFRLEHGGKIINSTSKIESTFVWRGTFKITTIDSNINIVVVPAVGSDVLYTIDIDNPTTGIREWSNFNKYVKGSFNPYRLDETGGSELSGGYIQYSQGVDNNPFPPAYGLVKAAYLESANKLLTITNSVNTVNIVYNDKKFMESNPLKMGVGFSYQNFLSADNTDFTKGGILALQPTPSGYQWYFRYSNIFKSDWTHNVQPNVTTFNGVSIKHYPFTPTGFVCNMGKQLYIGSQMPVDGINNQDIQKRLLGATSDTTVSLTTPQDNPNGLGKRLGDGMLIYEANFTLAEDSAMTPVTVCNLNKAITDTVGPLFVAAGIPLTSVLETWSVHFALTPTGAWHAIWMAFNPQKPDCLFGALVTTLTPSGTVVVKDGYNYYASVNIQILSPVKNYLKTGGVINNTITHPMYDGDKLFTHPIFAGVPYRGVTGGAKVLTGYYVIMGSSALYNNNGRMVTPNVHMEIAANGSSIEKFEYLETQDILSRKDIVISPYQGIGDGTIGKNIFEGAGIAAKIYSQSTSIFDNVSNNIYQTDNITMGMSNLLTSQFTVYFQEQSNVLISGKGYDMPATYIDILTIDPSPANKVFYAYLKYSAGQAVYEISQTVYPESSSCSLIAKINCGPAQISTIVPYNRFTMDGGHVSTIREGSAVMASTGSIYEKGNTQVMLGNSDFIP